MKNDRMNDKHERIVTDAVDRLLTYLANDLPKSEDYSFPNIALNVLTGTLTHIAYHCVDKKDHKNFIKRLEFQILENFKLYKRVMEEDAEARE